MIGTSYSNYVNSLSSQYRYDSVAMRGAYTGFNTAKVSYGARTQESYVNSEGVSYLAKIQSAAKSMQNALKNTTEVSTFEKMQAVSSNNNYLTVDSSSNPAEGWSASSVSISQVATGQENRSDAMSATERYQGGQGYQQFEIEVGGKSHQISVQVQGGDTNKTVQEKIASAINSRNIGVSASVSTSGGNSTLSIASANTGDDDANRFQIRDVSGNLVQSTGMDNIAQQAQDAVYSVDGGPERTSSTNNVDLGNGVRATLRGATGSDSVEVTKSRDSDYIKEQMNELVKSFNSLFEAGKSYSSTNSRLLNDLTTAYNSYGRSLRDAGISLGENGLEIDGDKLDAAIENGSLSNLMTDYGRGSGTYGFAGRLSAISTGVRYNTGIYAGGAARSGQAGATGASTETTSYNWLDNMGGGDTINKNNYDPRVYSNYMSLGYFMDMFV